jgi:ribosomal protein L17
MTRQKRTVDELRERALGTLLTDAFFTWPSALVIGLTLIAFFSGLTLFEGFQPWMWFAIGALLEVIYLVVTVSDPAARREALRRMLEEKFDPRDIKNLPARQRLQKALEYKRSIDAFIAKQSGAMQAALQDTAREIEDWIEQIYLLGKSIDNFESNAIVERDRREVPTQLRALETRLKMETDPAVRAELQEAIEIRQRLLNDLQKIASLIKRTEIRMDNTVAQLSSVHAKLQQMAHTREMDSTRARRLAKEIHDEVEALSDIVSAMEDMYSGGSSGYSGAVDKLSARVEAVPTQVEEESELDRFLAEDQAQRRASQKD